MNKRQKEVLTAELRAERKTLRDLKKVYKQAAKDCAERAAVLLGEGETAQSKIYQAKYQRSLEKQINTILDRMNSKNYRTLSEYLNDCYTNGFVGAMYDISGQGVPLILPIDQGQVVKAVQLDSKISEGLYSRMGKDTKALKKQIKAQISRGISNGSAYSEIARNINGKMDIGYNNAVRIVRTEGHRIQSSSALDAMHAAKEKGADVVKQWDSTLDGKTRESHRRLDGQLRELDEPFEIDGKKASAPGHFGSPKEDCNCRCALLQRARWALDDEELKTLQERAEYFGLDKTSDFEDFREKYLKAVDISGESGIIKAKQADLIASDIPTISKSMQSQGDIDEFLKLINGSNDSIRRAYRNYSSQLNSVSLEHSGYYQPSSKKLVYSYPAPQYMAKGKSKFSTLAHEYGHFIDDVGVFSNVSYSEVDELNTAIGVSSPLFKKLPSSSDEFLQALRKDKKELKPLVFDNNFRNDIFSTHASSGLQDAIDGMFGAKARMHWQHGDKYYNRKYNSLKLRNVEKSVQQAYKNLGMDASNQTKVKSLVRNYETASEMWANIMSAETCGGLELEYVKKYLPNSYGAYIEIMKGLK